MESAGLTPKLRLGEKQPAGGVKSTGPHRVKVLEDKIIRGIDPDNGKELEYVLYTVEENGEKKSYQTKLKDKNGKLSYLVQRMSEIPEGSEIIMEMKRQGVKNFVSITLIGDEHSAEVDEEEEN